jgi:hypothetical protein
MLSALALALVALVVGVGGAAAQGACAPNVDGCIIVNSNSDAAQPDEDLTLREALLITSGQLAVADLTKAEAAQVAGDVDGLGSEIAVYFDTDVFCEGCASRVITLAPPGLGGPAVDAPPGLGGPAEYYSGDKLLALPPGLGGPGIYAPPGLGGPAVDAPPGLGGPALVGMGLEDGVEVAAPVVIDGSRLTDEYAGIWTFGAAWLRGVHFTGFAGNAIEIESGVRDSVLIGSNGDGVNDAAEAVTFDGNGGDVVFVGD